MTDTAQPGTAAESVLSIEQAADAFKAFTSEQPVAAPRDDKGRFASTAADDAPEEEEIETDDASQGAEAVESDEDQEDDDGAAEEAQPEAVPPPASWSKDDAELWSSLPAEAQAKIAEREAQRDAAVGQKFQEAANVKRANEALITEATANRAKYAEAAEQVMSLIQPQKPNPNEYFTDQGFDQASYAIAQHNYEEMSELVTGLAQQRQEIAAQQAQEAEQAESEALAEINRAAAPKFASDVPELTDPAKGSAVISSVVQYAIAQGIPAEIFSPENMKRVSLAELHLAWKAQRYDAMKAAQAKVAVTPKPAAKVPSPAIRPGVPTTRGAVEKVRFNGAMDRLSRSGSVEDGAAVLKHLFKGR